MKLQALHSTGLSVLLGVGMISTIALQPTSVLAQPTKNCNQLGKEYQHLYSFDHGSETIVICQKGKEYYYIQTPNTSLMKPTLKPVIARTKFA